MLIEYNVVHVDVRLILARPVPHLHVFTNTLALTSFQLSPSTRQHVHLHRALQTKAHTHTQLAVKRKPTKSKPIENTQTPNFTPAFAPREIQGRADEAWLSVSLSMSLPLAWGPNGRFQFMHPELSASTLLVSVSINAGTTICINTSIIM